MAQDERRAVLEEHSHHIAIGLRYLPNVARRLHHGRESGEAFDFLTWFEYAPEDSAAFQELVQYLRATPEWQFVDRDVDIRLSLLPTVGCRAKPANATLEHMPIEPSGLRKTRCGSKNVGHRVAIATNCGQMVAETVLTTAIEVPLVESCRQAEM